MRLGPKELLLLRLADRQGLLSQPQISRFQQWALAYLIAEERKDHFGDIYRFQEFLWSIVQPDEYRAAMRDKPQDFDPDLLEGEENLLPEDFADIDRWLSNLDQPRTITAADFE